MHLMNLLKDNKGRGYFKAEATENETTLYIYDVIVSDDSFGGVSALNIIKELKAIKTGTISLRINSPGGDVFAARAIEQAIKEHPLNITAYIDGLAASAASYIAIAASNVVMAEGSFLMIHKAWTMAMGNADDFTKTAELLSKVDDSLVNTYAEKTKQDPEKIKEWMTNETWFTANEAVDLGFSNEISKPVKNTAWNLSAYASAPKIEEQKAEEAKPEIEPPKNLDHLKRKLDLITRAA